MASSSPRKLGIACAFFVLVLSNLLFALFLGHGASIWTSGATVSNLQPIMVNAIGPNALVVATLNNKVEELDQGRVTRSIAINQTINTIATSSNGASIYVGTSSGNILVYNKDLISQGKMNVPGNVSGLVTLLNGDVAVAYEQGQYTNLDYITIFKNGRSIVTKQIGVAVNAVVQSGNNVLFGTADSNIGLLTSDGKLLWKTMLSQPVQAIYQASPSDSIYVGDNAGNLYSLSMGGKVSWNRSISRYGLQTLESADGLILAGDKNGSVIVTNSAGKVLHVKSVFTPAPVVPSIIRQGNHSVLLMSNTGQSGLLNLSEATKNDIGRLILQLADRILSAVCVIVAGILTPRVRKYVGLRLRDIKRSGPAYALIWPAVILIVVFNVIPVLMAIFFSLTNYNLQSPLKFVGLSNFISMWSDMFFTVGMWHILLILFTSVIKELTFPLLVAELIFWITHEKIKYWFRTAFVLPSVVPGIVGILLWKQIFNPEAGLINSVLGTIGLGRWEHQWLGDPHTALWSVILAGFPYVDIFAFLVYYGGLIGISKDTFDAALVDGVKWWTRFWKIELPSIVPQIRLIMFFTIIGSIQTFTNIYVFTDGGPGTATSVPGLEMYNQISDGFFGLSSGMGVVLALMVLLVTFINFRVNRQEEA